MNEEDVRLFMKQDFVATASDGSSQVPSSTVPHPRSYGTFPRKIGRYALEDKIVPLEQAIRSSSGLPADILKLPQRGYLKVGYFADVVVFDPKTFRDVATYDRPHQYATGVRYLFVNGQAAIDEGHFTGTLAGRVPPAHNGAVAAVIVIICGPRLLPCARVAACGRSTVGKHETVSARVSEGGQPMNNSVPQRRQLCERFDVYLWACAWCR